MIEPGRFVHVFRRTIRCLRSGYVPILAETAPWLRVAPDTKPGAPGRPAHRAPSEQRDIIPGADFSKLLATQEPFADLNEWK